MKNTFLIIGLCVVLGGCGSQPLTTNAPAQSPVASRDICLQYLIDREHYESVFGKGSYESNFDEKCGDNPFVKKESEPQIPKTVYSIERDGQVWKCPSPRFTRTSCTLKGKALGASWKDWRGHYHYLTDEGVEMVRTCIGFDGKSDGSCPANPLWAKAGDYVSCIPFGLKHCPQPSKCFAGVEGKLNETCYQAVMTEDAKRPSVPL